MRGPGGAPPLEFEEYRLRQPLGRGSMGQVYLAHDTLLDRLVAVKFVVTSGEAPLDEATRSRFFQEARAIARLQHPNVVAIHRVGEVHRQPYLVSEFIRGTPLDQLALPVEGPRVLQIGIGLARGLAAAHRCGVLHRDIKPANAVLSEDGEVKLLDFGLAELLERSAGEAAPRFPSRPEPSASQATRPISPLPTPLPLERQTRPLTTGHETRPLAGRPPLLATPPLPPSPSLPESAPTRSTPPEDAGTAGTPLYLAPELWRGEPASRASDVYALGVLLYELATGHAPYEEVPLAQLARTVQEQRPRPLAGFHLNLPPGLAAVVDRCLADEPSLRFQSGDALRDALEALSGPTGAGPLPVGNPYRGLQSFDASHRRVFFGREAALRELLDRLRADPFILVAGDSGVGKSSVCRAAVLPTVAESGLDTGDVPWQVATFSPGLRPLEALVEALAPVLGESASALLERAHSGAEPGALARLLRQRPAEAPRLLLFVDQLEELVTFCPPAEATRLAEELVFIIRRAPRARVLATARSDCLTRLMALPGLGDELPRALHLLRALSPQGLREAITAPAQALGVRFESEAMVDELVAAAAREEGGLPLLQFTLTELWEARDLERQLLPAATLEALGGLAGALARHADAVVARLRPEERSRARTLLLKLVTPEGTRARRTESELLLGAGDAEGRAVLEGLVRGRLLLASETEGGEGRYELAHESLLTGWDTLRGWLGHDELRRVATQRLERAAAEWERLGAPAELLYQERRLAEVTSAAVIPPGPREASFLARSRSAARGRRLRRWALVVAVPVGVLAGVGAVRFQARARLDSVVAERLLGVRTQWAEARRHAEEAGRLRQEAFQHFDLPDRGEDAEGLWARAREEDQAADSGYARATSALEAVWSVEPNRDEVRALLADLLAERVSLASRESRWEQREELMARLATHDASGERRRRLEASALLSVRTQPPGGRVRLLAQEEEEADQELGVAPLEHVKLPAGSHLLRVEAPSRADVRVSLLLRPGEARELTLELPPAEAIPEGFLYVPPGRFLQGSADEGLRRTFFNTVPLHEVETKGFLIARHEVTFADWMAFLDTLPANERARRLPGTRGARSGVVLEQKGGRWHLTLRPTSVTYSAWEGEPIRYGRRAQRAVQDWRRFPVSAISFEDAQAYAAWMDASGRIPGARLCTDREWEHAARGADGRLFPSGNRLDPDDANIDVTYGREPLGFGPDEVGSHPRSRSPFGVEDMAGNVWEWTLSDEALAQPVIRGGSWFQLELGSQSANREPMEPTQRDPLIGLRLCATLRER
ncbi:SUMF1/EgtB/PvdO family nonheme iron enzyme [Stigmatella sp. ncwal1]|uniref:SUMF1/EgtB/PvdO family nonheme iron enzyme n=1 Tax=Stigmatella ashevillensis TaxID=2995309 RepID=A0ABT5DJ60_9BACT|nr:SUMF1/EgtB/PvdO family nonheme iron enzyme [Stigmatella ashevillena]MDC0713173.1 SUMF1/EgtB/PvdO family nonheme iron enzyme [Stigmatella ashevillena]